MFRIVRTATLQQLTAAAAERDQIRAEAIKAAAESRNALDLTTAEIGRLMDEAEEHVSVIARQAGRIDDVRLVALKLLDGARVLGTDLPDKFTRLLRALAGPAAQTPEAVER
ncbi:hypothetical protein [Streptomyces sp. NPDC056194]|uniref:hypothetical protein n=1 Tax=Streptomyces sp. NPDC056194 TaxID=3345744 RepID=UPI0035DAC4F9